MSLVPAGQSGGHHSCCRLQGGAPRRLLRLLSLDIAGAAAEGSRPRCRACSTTCTDDICLLAVQVSTTAHRKQRSGGGSGPVETSMVRLELYLCACYAYRSQCYGRRCLPQPVMNGMRKGAHQRR